MKKALLHGLTAGALTAVAGIIFNYSYSAAMYADFSEVINNFKIIGAGLFGTLLASLGYHFLSKGGKKEIDVIFNFIFLAITFASLYGSFSFELPTNVDAPELFVGLSLVLHFFPVLFWLATKPLFYVEALVE